MLSALCCRLIAIIFHCCQVDHDVCSNYGNWLYSAGIGNDPRENRKFNMIKQGLDYDNNVSSYYRSLEVIAHTTKKHLHSDSYILLIANI